MAVALAALGFVSFGATAGAAARMADAGSYVPVATWRSPTTPLPAAAWRHASGVDVAPDGRVFVADAAERRVTVVQGDGSVTVLAAPDGAHPVLGAPGHVAIDGPADRLYVADAVLEGVAVFALDGTRRATWAGMPGITGVAVAPDGTVVAGSATTGEVVRFARDGSRMAAWQAVAPAAGGDLIRAVDVDADGRVYVLLGREPTVKVFSAAGVATETLRIAVSGAPVSAFDVVVDYDPRLSADRTYWFATTRGLIAYTARDQSWSVNPLADDLSALAIDRTRGKFYLVTIGGAPTGGRILRLAWSGARNGVAERTWSGSILRLGELDGPEAIALGADDRAYVLDRAPRVQRFGLDGVVSGQLERLNPVAVDAGPDGALYATDGGQVLAFAGGADWMKARPDPEWTVDVPPRPDDDANAVGLVYEPVGGQVAVLDAVAGSIRLFGADGSRGRVVRLPEAPAGGSTVWADLAADGAGTLYALDRASRRVAILPPGGAARTVALPDGGRALDVGATGDLFTLDRDGWVRRYDGAGARTAAFDATRFDVAGASAPSDLAVSANGDVYVTDRDAGLVTVFRWDPAAVPGEPPGAGAQCRQFPDKRAEPGEVELGATVEVRLSVRGGCGSATSTEPRDIVLVLDRSDSMSGERLRILKGAALNFVTELDFGTARVGVVSFNQDARLEVGLTADPDRVREAIARIDADGQTRIDRGLAEARAELGRRGRDEARAIFILFSDGSSDYDPAKDQADQAKARGVEIYTVGIQAWARLMRAVATDAAHYFAADSARFLYGIFERLAERVATTTLFRRISVSDRIPAEMRYVAGSAVPSAIWDEPTRTLTWTLADVPFNGFALSYRLEPLAVGEWPTNVEATAAFVDGFDRPGQLAFPVPRVRVRAVRPTPGGGTPSASPTIPPTHTPTPTPTRTPTPSPAPTDTPTPTATPDALPVIFLPVALRERCVPAEKYADVALVLDTSSSMTGEKLAAAKAAASLFVGLVRLPLDRVAVVAFSNRAALVHPLSSARGELEAAIDGLATDAGTRIDLGLDVALDELTGQRRDPGHTPVIVLLTDGRQEDTASVRDAARRARDAGVQIFAIGLGGDVDAALLGAIAGASALYLAPGPADLTDIYYRIAVRVPCPPSAYWGRREVAGR